VWLQLSSSPARQPEDEVPLHAVVLAANSLYFRTKLLNYKASGAHCIAVWDTSCQLSNIMDEPETSKLMKQALTSAHTLMNTTDPISKVMGEVSSANL